MSDEHTYFPSEAQAEAYDEICKLAIGLPMKGTPRPGGLHDPIPDVYTPGCHGWSAHWCKPFANLAGDTWACAALDPADPRAVHFDELNGAQQTVLTSRWASAAPLVNDDWFD